MWVAITLPVSGGAAAKRGIEGFRLSVSGVEGYVLGSFESYFKFGGLPVRLSLGCRVVGSGFEGSGLSH